MEKYCTVKNRGAGTVVYKIVEDGIRRSFAPGETKRLSYAELEKLTYQPGGMTILTNFLQIQDTETIQSFNMKVEPEYHMSEKDIAELLRNGSIEAFLDALDFAPRSVIDLIKKYSVEMPLLDLEKRKALKEKTGFDVEAAIKHNQEDKEDEQTTILKQAERRVKPEEPVAPAGRRTAPKYNVVNTTTTEKSAE